jgi:hypothetical protein
MGGDCDNPPGFRPYLTLGFRPANGNARRAVDPIGALAPNPLILLIISIRLNTDPLLINKNDY